MSRSLLLAKGLCPDGTVSAMQEIPFQSLSATSLPVLDYLYNLP